MNEIEKGGDVGSVALTAELDALKTAKKKLPYVGRGGGTAKKGGACPRCGNTSKYRFRDGRWKYCTNCGYDRIEEGLFDSARHDAKRGKPVAQDRVDRALAYFRKVYT
ncbi:hypothetical protein [Methylococcus sp. EFPC2]|uniref:hypothetical protein n=1 Tax=Methylococcus sp. EFPC2 TaxID=2812648 RepID=UPI001967BD8C|nr:hypothetical protein [Methylococcus sp. EFPC2]QSA96517.1 hypothetical protein JWZ97_15020 [Methylococcus sp. EFPC2]